MRNCFHNSIYQLAAICLISLSSSCSSRIEAPQSTDLKKLEIKQELPPTINTGRTNQAEINLEQEASIENLCLEAWRKCLAGKKEESIKELKALGKQYPNSSSVLFMTGQVLDKCGKKEEAATYYAKSMHDSDFAVMSLFKLAESLRTTGNTAKAIARYKELVVIAPQFSQAHLGLAKALLLQNPKSPEAIKELNLVIALDPNNKEAKSLLAQ